MKIMGADVFRMRVCPKCGSRDYCRSITYARVTTVKNGKRTVEMKNTDACTFTCLKCKYTEHS